MAHLEVSVVAERRVPKGTSKQKTLRYHCYETGGQYTEKDDGRWKNYCFWVMCPICGEVVRQGDVALLFDPRGL